MDDMSLDPVRPQPARQPEAVASSVVGDNDALDRASAPHRLVPPALQQPQELRFVRIELLERLARDAWNQSGDQPARQAQLDHSNQGAALNKGSERPAQIIRP